MQMKLDQLQSLFSDALLYKNEIITEQIKDKASFSSADLLQVYRNTFVMGTTEALEATYPHVLSLVGEEFFDAVARQFILQQPPQENDIMLYGEGFSDFLESLPQLQAMPYIAEMARFEWLLEETTNTHIEADSFDITLLSNLDQDLIADIIFHIPEQVSLLSSEQDILNLYQMLIRQDVQETDLNCACYIALKKQPDFSVELIKLSKDEYSLVQQIKENRTLGQIQPQALHQHLPALMEKKLLNGFI
jgi:hypothetical protein